MDLEDCLAKAIDEWHEDHPDLAVKDILLAIESIRHKLTEGLKKHETAYCDRCQNTGWVECYCGGDLCICDNNGEKPCPKCGHR